MINVMYCVSLVHVTDCREQAGGDPHGGAGPAGPRVALSARGPSRGLRGSTQQMAPHKQLAKRTAMTAYNDNIRNTGFEPRAAGQ